MFETTKSYGVKVVETHELGRVWTLAHASES
jgi:hypothetical protein